MLLYAPEARLVMLLRQCYRSTRCLSASRSERLYSTTLVQGTSTQRRPRATEAHSKRSFTTTTGHTPENVAILGGGITGLSAAAMAAKFNPNVKVTLYESSDRLGGYVHSEAVQTSDGWTTFELGPRSLRPATPRGYNTLSLAQNLHLEEAMQFTSKSSAAGSSRFIYYPDKLVRLPFAGDSRLAVLWKLLTEPVFEGLAVSVLREFNVPRRPAGLTDESIGGFLRRRGGGNRKPVDNLVSAGMHGIFAGDVNQLSVRSLLPTLWQMEGEFGSLVGSIFNKKGAEKYGSNNTARFNVAGAMTVGPELGKKARESGLYTFRNGMQTLPNALADVFRKAKNADIKMGTSVSEISRSTDGKTIQVKTSDNQPPCSYSHVISTLPAHRLAPLIPIPALALIPYTTVMVVNLYYKNPNLVPPGFGYLIPQSVPFKQNPEFALGVVFDSHATPGIDDSTGTKLTVMLGGHYWDGRPADELPTPEEGQIMAERVLERHLKISEKPDRVLARLNKNCIPQYTVGHRERLQSVDEGIKRLFGGRLSVGGAWVDGVGVNDCIFSGVFQAMTLDRGYTGLELALETTEWLKAKMPPGILV